MRRLLVAALAAGALLLLTPLHAIATGAARAAAAVAMAREVGHTGLRGPAVDRALVLGAWARAGVDTRGLDGADALLHACTITLQTSEPRPAGPAPGDYALYRDTTGAQRVGMFLSQTDVAVVDGGAVRIVPPVELDGSIGDLTQERVIAERHSLLACRLAPQRWPGGVDDLSITSGRVALADPAETGAHLQWAADHPRDADPGFWHPIQRIGAAIASALVNAVSSLIDQVVSAAGVALRWLGRLFPWQFGPLLLVLGLLGRRFDGRLLHKVLTGVALAVMALIVGWNPVGWVLIGAVLGGAVASARGVPVLGAIGGGLVGAVTAVASFLVGTFTGVDDSASCTAGSVVFAVLSDVFLLRPMLSAFALASRIGRIGGLAHLLAPIEHLPVLPAVVGHGRSALDVAGTAGDALALRPHAIAETARTIRQGVDALRGARVAAAPALLSDAVPVHEAMSAAEALMSSGRRGVDLLSLAWRPSSVSSDLVGHAADALRLLDTELRTGLPSMPRLRALLTSMDPACRTPLLDAASHLSTHTVPQLRIVARLSHLHSGARTVMGIATHTQQPRPWMRFARSPIVRRVVEGLPGTRR